MDIGIKIYKRWPMKRLESKYWGWRNLKDQTKKKESLWWDLKRIWMLEEWRNEFEDNIKWDTGKRNDFNRCCFFGRVLVGIKYQRYELPNQI